MTSYVLVQTYSREAICPILRNFFDVISTFRNLYQWREWRRKFCTQAFIQSSLNFFSQDGEQDLTWRTTQLRSQNGGHGGHGGYGGRGARGARGGHEQNIGYRSRMRRPRRLGQRAVLALLYLSQSKRCFQTIEWGPSLCTGSGDVCSTQTSSRADGGGIIGTFAYAQIIHSFRAGAPTPLAGSYCRLWWWRSRSTRIYRCRRRHRCLLSITYTLCFIVKAFCFFGVVRKSRARNKGTLSILYKKPTFLT